MNECKCGRIPPCYGSLERAIYEEAKKVNDEWEKSRARHGKLIDKLRDKLMEGGFLDDTHDKVYELNRQMCDLERGLSNDFLDMQVRIADKLAKDVVEGVRTPDWAKNMLAGIPEQLSRAEYDILDEILKEKNRFMEEKKTKKMTKAEAFEYLKGKRVACDSNNEELVQRKLFEVGIRWRGGKADVTSVAPFLFINPNGITHCGSREWFDLHEYEEISADDILSIEIVEEKEETENINIELEKWIGVVRDKFCCNGWSFVISASNFALIKGDLIEERTPNK